MQSQSHLHMRDDGHGNLENGYSSSPSNAESSSPVTTKSSKQKSSMQLSTSSATSTSTMPSTAPAPHPQLSHKPSYTHSMTNDPNHHQNQNQSNSPTTPNVNNKTQFLLEQQIKMTQLHQLQQLQNHIFQQQMALISGQATPMSTVLPGSTSSELVGVRGGVGAPIQGSGAVVVRPLQSLHNGEQNLAQGLQSHGREIQSGSGPHTFSGLPTPAPSGEIRPMDYNTASPMMNLIGSLNLQHIEPLPNSMIPSSNPSMRSPPQYPNLSQPNPNIPQRYRHRHSSSLSLPSALQNNRQSHASYPSSPSTFSQISPTFQPISPMHLPILHPYHRPSNSHHPSSRTMSQMQAPWHSHPSSSPSTPISTHSERIDFNVYGVDTNRNGGSLHATPHLHPGSSVHASPSILGSGVGSINGHSGGFGHGQQLLDLDQDISPLTSPWLGATVSGSGGTAVSTSAQIASNPAGPPLLQKVEAASNAAHARRTSVSGNKRTASESGDEGDDAWSRGGTNRSSRKRPVLGNGGRTGSVGSNANAAATPGLVGSEKEKGGEKNDEGRNSGSTSPLTRNSTSPASEVVSSPTSLVKDQLTRESGGGGGHLNGGSSHAPPTPLVTSMNGSSRRAGKGSRSTTSTPLLRSTPPSTNLLSPMSPFSGVGGGGTASGRSDSGSNLLGVGGKGHGQELKSPSPVDLSLEGGQGQDGKNGRSMPPPPLPRSGVDVDMNSTEPTSPMDDSTGHPRDGMLGMEGMSFDSMMSLDEGMNVGMVGMGMSGLGGMGMGGLDGMSAMDMESMGGIGSMSMEEMGVGMGMNMGGMGGFGNGHEDSGMMGMGYGRDHDDEGSHISSSSSSARTNGGMTLAAHQQHRPQSHLQSHSEYQQQAQSHLSPAQTQHSRPLSHHVHSAQTHELQNEQNKHQDQVGLSVTGNQSNQQQQQPMMPVATPSSILNLGRIGGGSGGRLGSALSASTTSMGAANAALKNDGTGVVPRAKKPAKASKDGGGSNGGGASRKRSLTASMVGLGTGVGLSPALKPLRPAVVAVSDSTLPSPVLTGSIGSSSLTSKATSSSGISGTAAGSTGGGGSITATPILGPADAIGVIRQPKRTHRDAEQRRRNSQKQVIDELRRLLPPIALPNDSNATGDGADLASSLGLPGTSPFFFQPKATLLPGGLPPRGPPKVGGEGPNKNVSKLQVLLCGNEYIKLLKGRVDRRDDEIGRLRREMRRLRGLRGGGVRGCDDDEEIGEEVDLEKDLDAVERLQMMSVKGTGSSAGESSVQGRGSSGNDPMDEDDDDGDD